MPSTPTSATAPLSAAQNTPLLRPHAAAPRTSLARAVVWPVAVILVLLPCALLLAHSLSHAPSHPPPLAGTAVPKAPLNASVAAADYHYAQAAPSLPLTLAVIGDWGRRGHHKQRKVADALAQVVPADTAAVISVGDNFYHDGVLSEFDPHFNTSFNHVYDHEPLRALPWYLILGNHDYHGNVDAQLAYSRHSSRWRMPARYYERQFAPHLLALFVDTTPVADPDLLRGAARASVRADVDAQFAWLAAALARAPPHVRFLLFMHHNTYTMSTHDQGAPPLRARVDRIVAPYARRVVAVVNGHEHSLAHLQPFGAPGVTAQGIDYFTSGAGSKTQAMGIPPAHKADHWRDCCAVLPLSADPATSRAVWGRESHGFFVFTVASDSFEAKAYDHHGRQIYSYDRRLPRLTE